MLRYFLFALLTLTYSSMMTSCGGNDHSNHTHSHEDGHDHDHSHGEDGHTHSHGEEGHDHDHDGPHGDGAAFTSDYVCPMHCEGSGGDQAGTCPVCNMDYATLIEHTKDGHSH